MGYLSLVNTEANWLLRAFALSRSSVIGLSSMPMFSRLFALMNDQNRFGFIFRQFGCLHRICRKLPMLSSLSSKFRKLFPMFVQSSLFCLFYGFCFVFSAFLLIRVISMEGGFLPWSCRAGWCCSSV